MAVLSDARPRQALRHACQWSRVADRFLCRSLFIGEIELIDKDHEPRAVQAIEECWCFALPMKHYRPLLLNNTLFLRKLCVTLSHKNYRNIVSLTQNQSFPLVNRLAAFILLSQEGDLYHEKHTQAAEYLGVSYRHLYMFSRNSFTTVY